MNNSHITGGEFRGREVRSPKNINTHPMSARARLGIFNTLKSIVDVKGKIVLDLYAGTGALGFEALSRGAARVTFVDKSKYAIDAIRETAKDLGLLDQVTLVRRSISQVDFTHHDADIVFLDPPYDRFDVDAITCAIPNKITKEIVIVVSHPPMPEPGFAVGHVTSKRYSGCEVAFFKYGPYSYEEVRRKNPLVKILGL